MVAAQAGYGPAWAATMAGSIIASPTVSDAKTPSVSKDKT